MELLTAAQMRAIEAAAIASGTVTGLELMERAGAGVVSAILEEWPELATGERRAVVLCGPGNNGGDGFVVARLLRERGWAVEVFLYGDAERLPADARVNYERWLGMGEVSNLTCETTALMVADVIVDAIFGSGLKRPLQAELLQCLARNYVAGDGLGLRVCIDGPTGLCLDSGRFLSDPIPKYLSFLTVSFHRPRIGHFLGNGPTICRDLRVVDIGLNGNLSAVCARSERVECLDDLEQLNHRLRKYRGNQHKYNHGHALILSGPQHHGGAARLAARGALRVGAGVVSVGASGETMAEHAARLDAIMLRAVGDGAALADLLQDKRINVLCLGPGLGLDARAKGLVGVALSVVRASTHPTDRLLRVVLDADALTLIAADPTLFAALHKDCVLTPHAGEFARLFPDIAEKLNAPATYGPAYSKVDATREAAKRAGCVVLFKGPDTVIATPEGRCAINAAVYDRAAPWLATAGSGDVLAGFITGLMARGFDPFTAAQTAAWLHVECALSFGPGLIAEDIPEELPAVFRKLGL
jgi:ADP-dependent NAD(P)H-hydrate dehydratase / NAD(P)H-hydrate epimerase